MVVLKQNLCLKKASGQAMLLRGVLGFCAGTQNKQLPERSCELICPATGAWKHCELSLKDGRSSCGKSK